MPLRCTPFAPPQDWGQFDHDGKNDLLIVCLNAGNAIYPDWQTSVFDLYRFIKSDGKEGIVQYHGPAKELLSASLQQWVNLKKAGLRSNTRGVLYYDKKEGWLRLGELLPLLLEVVREDALSEASAAREAAEQAAVDAAKESSLTYYSFEEIETQCEQQQVLGEGGFGKVFKATLRGVEVAIKVVADQGCPSQIGTSSFLIEVNHVSRLQRNCDHIVKLLGFSHRPDGAICLVYDFANQGSLCRLPNGLSIYEAIDLFRQFAKGLEHMHSCHVVHADMKPPNLLLHKLPDGKLRGWIGDLGVAEVVEPGAAGISPRGTSGFKPPESCRKHGHYGYRGDVYAYGLTMGMLAGNYENPNRVSFCAQNALSAENSEASRRGHFMSFCGKVCKQFSLPGPAPRCCLLVRQLVQLIFQCCCRKEERRPTAAQVAVKLEQLGALSLEL